MTVIGAFYNPESGGFAQTVDAAAVAPQKAGDDGLVDLLAEAIISDHSREFRESADLEWARAHGAFESLEDWRPGARRKVLV